MSIDELSQHSDALAGLLMLPSLSASNCKNLNTMSDVRSTALHFPQLKTVQGIHGGSLTF